MNKLEIIGLETIELDMIVLETIDWVRNDRVSDEKVRNDS